MYKLKHADYNGNYYGFNLKKGYWYGEDTVTGRKIASSGWERGNSVGI